MESVMKFQKSDASAFSSMKTLMHSSSKHGDNANILRALTMQVLKTYQRCNPSFKPHEKYPQRILTHPSEGVQNNGFDNCEANLICKVHDSLICNDDVYTILDLLGTGTFGQVFRCQKNGTTEVFAVKVIKNKQAYHAQGLLEIKIAKLLNKNYDATAQNYVVRYFDSFEFKGHVCIIFELLSISLLDILTQNQFRGLPLTVVQRFTIQIMHAMVQLQDANIIHCDLKPENILLTPPQQRQSISRDSGDDEKTLLTSSNDTEDEMNSKTSLMSAPNNFNDWSNIKVIDFGSACFEGHTMYSYIQSRFYRAPEVILGVPYNGAIDMWSLACVCAEMYLGLPLFPGVSQHNQITRIVEMFGLPPNYLIEGKYGMKFFAVDDTTDQQSPKGQRHMRCRLKSGEEYARETNTEIPVLRKYLRFSRLDEVIMKCPLACNVRLTNEQKREEMIRRQCFLNFLKGLFCIDPFKRWTAKQAMAHPFITREPYTGPYTPPADLRINERKLSFLLQLQKENPRMNTGHYSSAVLGSSARGLYSHPEIATLDRSISDASTEVGSQFTSINSIDDHAHNVSRNQNSRNASFQSQPAESAVSQKRGHRQTIPSLKSNAFTPPRRSKLNDTVEDGEGEGDDFFNRKGPVLKRNQHVPPERYPSSSASSILSSVSTTDSGLSNYSNMTGSGEAFSPYSGAYPQQQYQYQNGDMYRQPVMIQNGFPSSPQYPIGNPQQYEVSHGYQPATSHHSQHVSHSYGNESYLANKVANFQNTMNLKFDVPNQVEAMQQYPQNDFLSMHFNPDHVGGSLPENLLLTDFCSALMRSEVDTSRMLHSQQMQHAQQMHTQLYQGDYNHSNGVQPAFRYQNQLSLRSMPSLSTLTESQNAFSPGSSSFNSPPVLTDRYSSGSQLQWRDNSNHQSSRHNSVETVGESLGQVVLDKDAQRINFMSKHSNGALPPSSDLLMTSSNSRDASSGVLHLQHAVDNLNGYHREVT